MKTIIIETNTFSKDVKKDLIAKISYLGNADVNFSVLEKSIELEVKEEDYDRIKEETDAFLTEICETYKNVKEEILFTWKSQLPPIKEDTFSRLIEEGMVFEFDKGLVGFGEEFLQIQQLLDKIIVGWGKEYNSKEYSYPDLIGLDTLNQYNYLEEFPQYLMFSSHLKNDVKLIQHFGKNCNSTNEDCFTDNYIGRPKLANKLAVCPHVYKQYEGKTLDIEKPIVISTVGKCKRYEAANMNKCERLLDFTMREIVILGQSQDILQIREDFVEKTKKLIQYLQIDADIKSASDPFFSSKFKPKILLQRKLKLKYELTIRLPYCDDELAAGSFNYHYDHFAQCFDMKGKNGDLTTGCMAFGLERFAYALISQYGVDRIDELIERLKSYQD